MILLYENVNGWHKAALASGFPFACPKKEEVI